ncbi:MAG: lamin tail domain-containing protein [Saprospiraceae bacterium]|nr:lamin tail domain-containing protein [Saprospiraceae bacterium]MCF8251041.1 lamin tail domain-containing protein [Saprospiraceae bacterium]MCF8281497.1 lamin tail domain-containing protein [Bacteroidales bacterium]MCF8311638.1 lamin tail domain-containing protein [Saprospiraceae bacterium]MCF8440979.1 lamin tail domain-containing protein [Saprospiraceae bacterium]
MKRTIFTLLTFCGLIATLMAQDHIVTLSGIAFTPNNLTINVGETVQWNNTNGTHNVNGSTATFPSNPAGFMSGGAMPSPWMFSHTFNTPGVYQYRCDPHFSLGMTGVITVNAAPAGDVVITEINYNNPGTDNYEFIEFYNRGTSAVQLQGWTISTAINYTFPDYTLDPGELVVVSNNATLFEAGFGFVPLGWDPASNNVLNNTGENIVLKDAAGTLVDSVHYSSMAPWPTAANGGGPSLVLCGLNSDNDNPSNWAAAAYPTGVSVGPTEIRATPGGSGPCVSGPYISYVASNASVFENDGNVLVRVAIASGNASPTAITITANAGSTATAGSDYTASLPITITFPAGVVADTQMVTITVNDDAVIEGDEVLLLDLTNPTNGANVTSSAFKLNIADDDTPLSGALLISGIFDTQVEATGTWAKGCELKALQDIPDLSIYSVGFANNGGGTDGEEAFLPAISLLAGECVWVTNDSAKFHDFFGFPPTLADNDAGINGDDAIELFENGQVIDVFGELSYPSGSTLAWNYLDGWAYRKDGTDPDGILFTLNNWSYSGTDVFDLQTSNATASVPFPVCDYSPVAPMTAELVDDDFVVQSGTATNLNVLSNDILPAPITALTIVSGPTNGSVTVNGLIDISYTSATGYCGTDAFTYEVCDAGGCDQATVNLTVECFPLYDISTVTTVTGGQPDSVGVTCELRGIVYGIDFQGVSATGVPLPAVQFYINDGTGGISVFGTQAFGYAVQEGDEVAVRGKIVNFNCLTQITNLDTLYKVSSNNALLPPAITTFLNESFESELVEFTNMAMIDPADWNPGGTGFDVRIKSTINPTADTIIMRIDNDCELFNMPAPNGPFHAIGIGGQYVSGGGGNCASGYQFLPRYAPDIILLNAADEALLEGKISFYPNPVGDLLFIKTDNIVDDVIMANALGQQVMQVKSPGNKLDVSQLQPGLYLISFRAGGEAWTSKFVKQ